MSDKLPSLTDCLKSVGEEMVDICINGESMHVTKTEALARKMYVMAMGGIEEVTSSGGEVLVRTYKPDYRVAKMIREFTEGKAPVGKNKSDKPDRPAAGQFSSATAKRLSNQLNQRGNDEN